MLPSSLLDQMATVRHFTVTEDAKGNPRRTLDTTQDYPCRLDQSTTVEEVVRRDTVTVIKRIILPADAVISAADEVTVDEVTYVVEGAPDRLRAFGVVHHVEALLRASQEV